MKRLHFSYEMELQFGHPVTEHYFVLRFVPESSAVQTIEEADYELCPAAHLARQTDGFGNSMLVGDIRESHEAFSYRTTGIAQVSYTDGLPEELHPVYRRKSPLTAMDEGLEQLYQKLYPSETAVFPRAVCLMHGLYENFSYRKGSTDVRTTAAEAFHAGGGVCQDYAHILIALCRRDGIPARYVSGLMLGEGASHAWTEVYVDGRWRGLDATNDRVATDDYIRIAQGRDYQDCPVERGVLKGDASQAQHVHVKVEEK
ncbi:MAG: transglutaminase family protein [Lachnospiraceae bacterium]|nr:transglutaminase family protein [Lachnospiraceae bacterium]